MIIGANTVFEHAGKQYHIQAEDLGFEHRAIELRVYDGGTLLWRKRVPYAEELTPAQPKAEREEQVAKLLERTLHTVQAAIAKGKIG
ncbi:MAG TPA: hypothetical protein VJU18_13035 [Vicinamibacteria bacterium]|nr:hypothetical protein [Vicinamibacteria bacterium]